MTIQKDWQIFDDYLTLTRYAVRDPKNGQAQEKNYQEILSKRIIPELKKRNKNLNLLNEQILENLCFALNENLIIPATPFLMSFGNVHTRRPGYFSCYPLGQIEDSLDSIDEIRKKMRTIYMAGGGAGIDLSKLRNRGAAVDGGQGIASGPVGFLPDFDAVTGTTNQGGRRRGALLVQLDWDHPDIKEYVKAKDFTAHVSQLIVSLPPEQRPAQNPHLSNMNISVNAYGDFWKKTELVNLIAKQMWTSGDPGLLFVDNMIEFSPIRAEDEPKYSNPCGEYLASAGTACNLITINAAKIARQTYDKLLAKGYNPKDSKKWFEKFKHKFWGNIQKNANLAAHLGNTILEFDEGYPLPEIKEATKRLRPVGVGMSGFHTALLLAYYGNVLYGSPEAQNFAKTTQGFLTLGTLEASLTWFEKTTKVYENKTYWTQHLNELSLTINSSEPPQEASKLLKDLQKQIEKHGGFYNCLTTSQAPTGSVSIFLRNLDTGIEPYYALEVTRRVRDSKLDWLEFTLKSATLNDLLEQDEDFFNKVKAQTALELSPAQQLEMLAAFQYHNHTGVSKTINLPKEATVKDIEELIIKSRDMRLKGFTVYRDGSLDGILSATNQSENDDQFDDNKVPDIGADRQSRTFTASSHNLTAHITLTNDENKNIREVFITAGDVGASINAVFSALGMILSVALREAPWLFSRFIKVLSKVKMGERVTAKTKISKNPIVGDSLPNVIGQLMNQYHNYLNGEKYDNNIAISSGGYDLCPECHELSLHREGSCLKCNRCGFTTC